MKKNSQIHTAVKAFVGFVLIFLYHIPRLISAGLLVSYAYVFNNVENITANPLEHIKRAQKLLKSRHNSILLYAALELRFAVERMVKGQLLFKNKVSNSTWKKRDPTIHAKALRENDARVDCPYEIFFLARRINEKIPIGAYKPFPIEKVKEIDGRLGELLHIKNGPNFGISSDPWYKITRSYLKETANYLQAIAEDNVQFFAYAGDENYELVIKDVDKQSSVSPKA